MQNPFEITLQNQADDEEIIKVWRHHPVTLFKPVFKVLLFAAIPAAIVLFTGFAMFGNPVLFVLFVVILAIVATLAAYEWVSWYGDVYVLTNYRIVDVEQRGFFYRKFAEASLDKIQDISYETAGILQTVFRYGDVLVQTAGTVDNITMEAVSRPDLQALYLLRTQQEQLKDQDKSLTAEQLIELLAKHRDDLDDLAKAEQSDKAKAAEAQAEQIKRKSKRL